MAYYFSKTVPFGFDEAVQKATEALKREGFGIITEIDVKQTLKTKIGVDFRNSEARPRSPADRRQSCDHVAV